MQELKEHSFWVWFNNSRNIQSTLKKLQKEGYSISAKSLYLWKKELKWEDRAEKIDTNKSINNDKKVNLSEEFVSTLLLRKEMYDEYFSSLPKGKVDNQAMFAYMQLCKIILELSNTSTPNKKGNGLDDSKVSELRKSLLGIE